MLEIVPSLVMSAALQCWACLWGQDLGEVGFGFGVFFASESYGCEKFVCLDICHTGNHATRLLCLTDDLSCTP
jgi:hypothetical protein